MGLGSARLVSLAEAREKAATYRRTARDGGDPLAEKRKAQRLVPTLQEAARTVHAEHSKTWKNDKHADQWMNTLEQYAFQTIGSRRVDHVETPDVLKVLGPIWLTRPETARRVKQRLHTVLDWARASGFRSGENPVDGVARGLPRQPDSKGHHKAAGYARRLDGSRVAGGTDNKAARYRDEEALVANTQMGPIIAVTNWTILGWRPNAAASFLPATWRA